MDETNEHEIPAPVAAFAQRLSERVRAALPRWEWKWHPEWRLPHEELQRDLAEHGLPEWPFLWPLEEAFAGALVELGGWQLAFGVAAEHPYLARANLLDERGQPRFVTLGDWGNDALVADETGRVYVLTERGVLTLTAPSFESFLEHHAMSPSFDDWCLTPFTAHLLPKTAASALATHLRVAPVVEAYNDVFKWWRDDALTLYESNEVDTPTALWSKTLEGLVRAIDTAAGLCPTLKVTPVPSYDDAHVEVLKAEEIRARAPSVETLAARPGARRIDLIGEPSIFPGKPPSTGDVWISGGGDTLQIEVLERREGQVVNYWKLTPTGSHALLISTYGKG